MTTFELVASTHLPRTIDQVFAFFADAGNLNLLTPPWLRFEILTPPPITMRVGTLIDYRLGLHGLPLRWRTRITVWEPPARFVDEQLRGPYRLWVHTHTFTPAADGTIVQDRVEYAVLGGTLIHRLFVAPDLRRIFCYRQGALRRAFSLPPAAPTSPLVMRRISARSSQ